MFEDGLDEVERTWEQSWLTSERIVTGWCSVCQLSVSFHFSYLLGSLTDGTPIPAWTETFSCLNCGSNARMRNAITKFREAYWGGMVYLHEGLSSLAGKMRESLGAMLVCSEYLPEETERNRLFDAGIAHEDLHHLSFDDNLFDFQISLDVLEHLADPSSALREMSRVLKPGGLLILTTPIVGEHTVVRAELEDGQLLHREPPTHHGDHVVGKGNLVFNDFGRDILQKFEKCGFSMVSIERVWDPVQWILGANQNVILATK